MLPFAIRSVTPRPRELIVRIPKEFLPDIIRDIMPGWFAEDEDSGPEVYGIPGLRAQFHWGRIILNRPGFAGRISIPAPAGRWRKAALIATDLWGDERTTRMPWLTHPDEWHPEEVRCVESWPGRYSTSSWQYRKSRFASQVLRRLPGLCPTPRAYYHDLWFNRVGDTCSIQFEWAFGATHKVILGKLLDPVFGPDARIELFDGQNWADCFADTARLVKVHSAREPDCWIDLRRAVWGEHFENDAITRKFGEQRRDLRKTVEKKYEY
jgi:hypothetical protein